MSVRIGTLKSKKVISMKKAPVSANLALCLLDNEECSQISVTENPEHENLELFCFGSH